MARLDFESIFNNPEYKEGKPEGGGLLKDKGSQAAMIGGFLRGIEKAILYREQRDREDRKEALQLRSIAAREKYNETLAGLKLEQLGITEKNVESQIQKRGADIVASKESQAEKLRDDLTILEAAREKLEETYRGSETKALDKVQENPEAAAKTAEIYTKGRRALNQNRLRQLEIQSKLKKLDVDIQLPTLTQGSSARTERYMNRLRKVKTIEDLNHFERIYNENSDDFTPEQRNAIDKMFDQVDKNLKAPTPSSGGSSLNPLNWF